MSTEQITASGTTTTTQTRKVSETSTTSGSGKEPADIHKAGGDVEYDEAKVSGGSVL